MDHDIPTSCQHLDGAGYWVPGPPPRPSVSPQTAGSAASAPSTRSLIDYVVVRGLSSTSSVQVVPGWLKATARSGDCIITFTYAPLNLFAGRRTQHSIRTQAMKLLHGLKTIEAGHGKRLIALIAWNVGGAVVKDAMTVAYDNPDDWFDVVTKVRILVFVGYPHRSNTAQDLEQRLRLFLSQDHGSLATTDRRLWSSINAFAATLMDINATFIHAKPLFRCQVFNIYSDGKAGHEIHQVFDMETATLGVPFERRFKASSERTGASSVPSVFFTLRGSLHAATEVLRHHRVTSHDTLLLEQKLIAFAAHPIRPFHQTKGRFATPETLGAEVENWAKLSGPRVLHIQGCQDIRVISQEVFTILQEQQLRQRPDAVLYFSCDELSLTNPGNVSVREMEAVFLAQLTCQFPRPPPSTIRAGVLDHQLDNDSWAAGDITRRLDTAIWNVLTAYGSTVILVLNHFDSLPSGTRAALLGRFRDLAKVSERRLKLVIATRCDPGISDHVPATILTTIDMSGLAPCSTRFLESLSQARPEVFLNGHDQYVEEAKHVAEIDPVARFIIQEQLLVRGGSSDTLAVLATFGPELPVGPWDDVRLARLLDRLFRAGDQAARARTRSTLKWVLYGLRPSKIQEWATMQSITQAPHHDDPESFPAFVLPDTVTTHLRELRLSLEGIVVVRDNELFISHPRIRDILLGKTPMVPTEDEKIGPFFWDDFEATAHFDMAELCLKFLGRPAVQELAKKGLCTPTLDHESKKAVPRNDLCSYALLFWAEHYKMLGAAERARLVGLLPADASVAQDWASEHWAASNWVTRDGTRPQTLFPILAGIGTLDLVRPQDPAELRLGILAAISMGHTGVAFALLHDNRDFLTEETLVDALMAATGAGFEQLALDLAKRTTLDSESASSATITLQLPPSSFEHLVRKAALSGMTGLLELLLSAQGAPRATSDQTNALFSAAASHNKACFKFMLGSTPSADHSDVLAFLGRLGDVEILKCFLSFASLDFHQFVGPSYWPVSLGHFGALQELLSAGLDLSTKARSLIHSAAIAGHAKCTTLLLRHGANANLAMTKVEGVSETPLLVALRGLRIEVARALLDGGALPDGGALADVGGRSPSKTLLRAILICGSWYEKQGLELLELLLDRGADPSGKDGKGTPVLFTSRSLRVHELFLDHGFDVNVRDEDGCTALHHAATLGRDDLISLLLSRGAKVNGLTKDGRSCLYCAVPFPNSVRTLLAQGADPCLGRYQKTPLMEAASSPEFVESLRMILETEPPLEIRYPAQEEFTSGTTAFNMAAQWGSSDGIIALAEAGADINNADNYGIPPLHRAAGHNLAGGGENLNALLLFLYRLNINATDGEGRTALHLDLPISRIKRLLRMGANANIKDKEGNTPLHFHVARGEEDTVILLLRHGADLNMTNIDGDVPLVNAIRNINIEMAKTLVIRGANIEFSSEGWLGGPLTAAFFPFEEAFAPRRRRTEMLECLMDLGADVNASGGLLARPINAALLEDPRMMSLLLQRGARVDFVDDMGRSPIHFAATREVDLKDLHYFPSIIAAGGDRLARDGLGRTTLHWAALHKQPLVAKYILSEFADDEARTRFANSPDAGGWTALAFALCSSWHKPNRRIGEIPPDRGEVVKVLLEAGADGDVRATSESKTWTLREIADYECVPGDVLKLIDPGVVEKGGHREHENEDGFGRGYWMPRPLHPKKDRCCVCVQFIMGFCFTCRECQWFDLCWRCYPHRGVVHSTDDGHQFDKVGPEFEDDADSSRDSSPER